MSSLLLLGLLAAPNALSSEVCPDEVSIRQLKRTNATLVEALTVEEPDADTLGDAVVQTHTVLGCLHDVPPHLAAKSFLLLGATNLAQGDDFQAAPYIAAAAVLGGESTWDESLGPDMRTRFFNALASERPRGVVWAPEFLLVGGYHLVGSQGPPPWLMPVGTFTFEWSERSVPINVNEYELTMVVPRTFDEFDALVEGVTEADLEEPDYDAIVYYDTRREQRRARREQREQQEPVESQDEQTTAEGGDHTPEENVDSGAFFDELADYDYDDIGSDPPPTEGPEPSGSGAGLALSPHVGLGAAWTTTGAAAQGSAVEDESFGGFGVQLGLGLGLDLGERFTLRPEISLRSAGNGADLDVGRFGGEGWGSDIPVEPSRNRLLSATLRLPALLKLGSASLGLAPAWSVGRARVTALTACTEGTTCVAPLQGTVMAGGGSLLLGFQPGRSPIVPWLDLTALHDGERAFVTAALVLAWEGSP